MLLRGIIYRQKTYIQTRTHTGTRISYSEEDMGGAWGVSQVSIIQRSSLSDVLQRVPGSGASSSLTGVGFIIHVHVTRRFRSCLCLSVYACPSVSSLSICACLFVRYFVCFRLGVLSLSFYFFSLPVYQAIYLSTRLFFFHRASSPHTINYERTQRLGKGDA